MATGPGGRTGAGVCHLPCEGDILIDESRGMVCGKESNTGRVGLPIGDSF